MRPESSRPWVYSLKQSFHCLVNQVSTIGGIFGEPNMMTISAGLCLAIAMIGSATAQQQYSITNLGTLGSATVATSRAGTAITGQSLVPYGGYHAFLYIDGQMKDLGTVEGVPNSYGNSVNKAGQVVGLVGDSVGARAFLYSGGQISLLVGGAVRRLAANQQSSAAAINEIGQVIGSGYFQLEDGSLSDCKHPFLYSSNGVLLDLITATSADWKCGDAAAINDSGTVVGTGQQTDGLHAFFRAFLFKDGLLMGLGTLGGSSSSAVGINGRGQIVGSSLVPGDSYQHAFLFTNGAMVDLGTLGGPTSTATAINELGEVVGYSSVDSTSVHAFLSAQGVMKDLGTLGGTTSEATSVNSSGYVTGTSTNQAGYVRAFVYTPAIGIRDLNDLIPSGTGWVLTEGISIADDGSIVGNGYLNGEQRAFLLTPTNCPAASCARLPRGGITWLRGESDFKDALLNNDGSNAGSVTFAPGKVGQAMHFDGSSNSFVSLGNDPSISPTQQISIEAWVKPNFVLQTGLDAFASKRDGCGANRSYLLGMFHGETGPDGVGTLIFSASVAGDDVLSNTKLPNDGEFHHVAGTYDGQAMRLYLDGQLVGEKPHTGAIPTTSDPAYVGLQSGCQDRAAVDIDELTIYNRGLSSDEVQAIADSGAAGKCNCTPPPAGSVSAWTGDGTLEDAVGSNHGTNGGGVSFSSGKVGQALHLSTTSGSYVDLGNAPSMSPAAQVTVEGWIKPDFSVNNVVDTVISKRDGCGSNRSYSLQVSKGALIPSYTLGTIVWSASFAGDDVHSNVPFPNDGQFHHLAGTYDGQVMRLYLDGVLVGDRARTAPIAVTSDPAFIGLNSGCGHLSAADIDEVTLYERALSPSEIQTIVGAGSDGKCLRASKVSKSATTTTLLSELNPSTFADVVILRVAVISTGDAPTGTAVLLEGDSIIDTSPIDSEGKAAFSLANLSGGTHSLTANYSGDANSIESVSAAISQVVNPAPSNLVIASSSASSTFGQSVEITASLSSTAGIPTGTVSFYEGASLLGSGTLSTAGQASILRSDFSVGSHAFSAIYAGDGNYSGATSLAISQNVSKATSTVVLSSTPNPSTVGQNVMLTATVTGQYGGSVTGSLTFKKGSNTVLGTASVVNGVASLELSSLGQGSHVISAIYFGDTGNLGSTSPAITQTVAPKAPSSTTLSSSLNPSYAGELVTLTATVTSSAAGSPSGTITFKQGQLVLGSAEIDNRQAKFNTSSLSAGSLSITALYSGDAQFASSTSAVITQTVNKVPSSASLASSPNPSTLGSAVLFSATVTTQNGTVPTGTVTFKEGSTVLGIASLSAATPNLATFSSTTLSRGRHNIKAVYSGSNAVAGSTSLVITQVVQ
jgi:probable HAF family extracellular repeat protein